MAEDRMLSDEVLLALIKKNSGGGGGGGTDDYNDLKNQPKIGGVTLTGNKTASDLGLATETALADKADKSVVKNEFIGKTAEWNALTAEQKKAYDTYQITDDYTEGGGLPDYSTTEQKTGQKWIDGKDIYVCVFDQGSDVTIGSSTYRDTNIDASGIANIIEARAMQSNGTYKLINASCDATYVKITSPFSSDTVRYIILFYTKTA